MLSGPAAFLSFALIRALLTSCSVTMELTSATVPLAVLLLASNNAKNEFRWSARDASVLTVEGVLPW